MPQEMVHRDLGRTHLLIRMLYNMCRTAKEIVDRVEPIPDDMLQVNNPWVIGPGNPYNLKLLLLTIVSFKQWNTFSVGLAYC